MNAAKCTLRETPKRIADAGRSTARRGPQDTRQRPSRLGGQLCELRTMREHRSAHHICAHALDEDITVTIRTHGNRGKPRSRHDLPTTGDALPPDCGASRLGDDDPRRPGRGAGTLGCRRAMARAVAAPEPRPLTIPAATRRLAPTASIPRTQQGSPRRAHSRARRPRIP